MRSFTISLSSNEYLVQLTTSCEKRLRNVERGEKEIEAEREAESKGGGASNEVAEAKTATLKNFVSTLGKTILMRVRFFSKCSLFFFTWPWMLHVTSCRESPQTHKS